MFLTITTLVADWWWDEVKQGGTSESSVINAYSNGTAAVCYVWLSETAERLNLSSAEPS
jgi:hypothetical protein